MLLLLLPLALKNIYIIIFCCNSRKFYLFVLFITSTLVLFLMYIVFDAAGCENGCSGHGQCTMEDGSYLCVCIQGWAGSDCSIPLEMTCNDDVDNDHGNYRNISILSSV